MSHCSIDGCTNPHPACRGLCRHHYRRLWLYGDPLGTPPEDTGIRTLRELVDKTTDDCILWPLGVSSAGYGKVKYQKRTRGTHVVALELTSGPKPADKDVAAHSCRNKSCVNPRHLRWATHSENHMDKWRDGTAIAGERNHNAVLTVELVRAIRQRAASGESDAAIYRDMGLDRGTVRDVISRRTWRHVDEVAA